MSEEEIKAIRMQFQEILNKLVNNKIAPTGTAILEAEQPMILLFEELMNKIEKQQQELDKEKEKNKELELCLKAEEKYSEGLNRDIKSLLNIEPNDNFISKDKIKDKIKELEKDYEEYKDSQEWEIFDETKYAYELLQELLEE